MRMDKNVFYFRKMTLDIYYDRVRGLVDLTSLVESARRSELDFPPLTTEVHEGTIIGGKLWVDRKELEKTLTRLGYYLADSIRKKLDIYDEGTREYNKRKGGE